MFSQRMSCSFVIIFGLLGSAFSANILAIFPHTGKSHFDVYEPLVLALAGRGHSLTVLSFYPQKTPVPNYTDISLVGLVPLRVNQVQFSSVENSVSDFISMAEMGLEMCEKILTFPKVRESLTSERKFDLAIVEFFNTNCFLGLVHKYGVPFVGIASASPYPEHEGLVGTPSEPAYVPHADLPLDHRMTLLQRVINVVYSATLRTIGGYYAAREQETVGRLLGEMPPLSSVAHNVSLMLVNTHHSMLRARPLTPSYVQVGGIHIHQQKPLSKELEKYLNDSPEGVLLFSMGSVLQSSSFPDDKRQAFMDAFAELPVRVLMKWENDTLPGKPDNVRLSRWLPQRDVLAHPKIRAFMGHGGLLSTSEAVYCGVPMVLIPMFGDQPNNVAHLQYTGAAVKLGYNEISKETVLRALRAVLYEPSYKEKAKTLSEQYRDRPMAPLDTAVYWTEYVIRHKGARHLRSAAVDMPWYQLWLLDVIAVLLASLTLTLWLLVWLARRATRLVANLLCPDTSHRKSD